MPISIDELSKNALGGTEQMKYRLQEKIDSNLLDNFQIICSRVREMDKNLIPLYWLHDLPDDPESQHLDNGGYTKFEKLVFVSNWQMQAYINRYSIPWYKSVVLKNAIEPLDRCVKENDTIRFIYHTTPHRGLNLLVPTFAKLAEKYNNIQLDVFSSFEIYGWKERDEPYKQLFDFCKEHPQINYYGYQPNHVVREALLKAHIFAYPSVWLETSCIALIEAMSAGCLCIHPNYGALYETASNLTWMYQYVQDPRDHMNVLYYNLEKAIQHVQSDIVQQQLKYTKQYIDTVYSWENRIHEWNTLLTDILRRKRRL